VYNIMCICSENCAYLVYAATLAFQPGTTVNSISFKSYNTNILKLSFYLDILYLNISSLSLLLCLFGSIQQ